PSRRRWASHARSSRPAPPTPRATCATSRSSRSARSPRRSTRSSRSIARGATRLRTIAAYVILLNVFFALGQPGFGAAPTAFDFLLKDTLHLDAERVALANALVSLPLYAGALFGFV